MEIAPKPENEAERIRVVRSLGLLDTPPEERFDRYTRFVKKLFGVPISFVSILGEDKQWFKSTEGFELKESSRDESICSHTILEDRLMVIHDLIEDPRFVGNPFVREDPHLRFYAGVKLRVNDGIAIGTLCLADTKPRYPTDDELQLLIELAELLEEEFKSHAQATTDAVTGVSNHRGFYAIASHALALCKRSDKAATVLSLEIANFPEINADHGRDVGDRVLTDVGQLLINEFRCSDVVARTGAAKFSVLLTGTDTGSLTKPLQNLERAFHEENMNLSFDISCKVSSIGYDADRFENAEEFIQAVFHDTPGDPDSIEESG